MSMQTSATPRIEMLQVADAVSREKSIDREIVLEAMEQAIQKASKAKYGPEYDIRAVIDRKSGAIHLHRYREVVEVVEDENLQISLVDANVFQPGLELEESLVEPLPPIDLGRIAAQSAKQVIVQKVRDAEREKQFELYKDRAGEIIVGEVKRVEYGNVTVDLGHGEGILRRDQLIAREVLRTGERVRCYIADVRREQRGPQIFLSRTHTHFLAMLFAQEVPEIYDGIIEIKAVARDPGSRAKIAVHTNDVAIDPVGACVGMRGSRVQAVVNELQGEKIDIIPYTEDTGAFVISALAPAKVSKIVLDEARGRIEVVVAEDQLSLAIGRRGQNVRLASQLCGWELDIMTEEEESSKRSGEFKERSELFINSLDIDDLIAQLLVTEGFTSIDQLAYMDVEELTNIEGFNEDLAAELQQRALNYMAAQEEALNQKRIEMGVADDLLELDIFDMPLIIKLAENDIKSRDDLADLAGDELIELLPEIQIDEEQANAIIMKAREHWFAEDGLDDETGAADDADTSSS